MTFRLIPLILLMALPCELWAARVTQVKDNRALIDLAGGLEDAKVGDELIAMDSNGKRKAILKLKQVKGSKAIADILKGRTEVGHDVSARTINTAAADNKISRPIRDDDLKAQDESPEADAYYKNLRRSSNTGAGYGVFAGLQQTNMIADFKAGAGVNQRTLTANMKGSSFGVLGYYDYPLLPTLQFRGLAGYEQMTASGSIATADCAGSTSCEFNVSYLSLYGQVKFNFFDNRSMRAWVAGGYGFLLAMSKASNVLDTSQISTNQVYTVSGGTDFVMGRRNYIPIAIEYGMHPASATVKVNSLTIRAGYGWSL